VNIQEKGETTENIPVVCEFKNVFPKELSKLAPQREIDFEIELILGSQPISKAPYCMAPTRVEHSRVPGAFFGTGS